MNRTVAQVLILSVVVGLSSQAAWALPAVFTMKVVEINGSSAGLPSTDVTVEPGDIVKIEVFLENWAPEELGTYQFAIDVASMASGGGSPLALAEVPCASDLDCPVSGTCDLGAGVCQCLESIFVSQDRVDFVFFQRPVIAAANCFGGPLAAGAVLFVAPGTQGALDDGFPPRYLGTVVLSIPDDASDVYTLEFEQNPSPPETFAFNVDASLIAVDATAAVTLSIPSPTVPTVSTWGTVVLALLLLTAAKILHRRRRVVPRAISC